MQRFIIIGSVCFLTLKCRNKFTPVQEEAVVGKRGKF